MIFKDSDIAQQYAQYAYDIGGERLLQVMICENGGFDIKLEVEDGGHKSYGLCMLNYGYERQRNIINDTRFTSDRKWHIQKCQEGIERGIPFYGPDRVSKYTKRLECRDYAKKYIYRIM